MVAMTDLIINDSWIDKESGVEYRVMDGGEKFQYRLPGQDNWRDGCLYEFDTILMRRIVTLVGGGE